VHVFSQFDGNPEIAAYLPALWDHSVAVAAIAQRIAGSETRKKAMVEESFTAGLLHEVGKVVLLAEITVSTVALWSRRQPIPLAL
jgi:HD-like signal output (HDOD) protein